METINEMADKLFCKLYCSHSPKVDFRIRKTFALVPACGTMLGNHCIIQVIWRHIFVTAANQKAEASIVKQNAYFMGLLYSVIMCFFFSAVHVPFLL